MDEIPTSFPCNLPIDPLKADKLRFESSVQLLDFFNNAIEFWKKSLSEKYGAGDCMDGMRQAIQPALDTGKLAREHGGGADTTFLRHAHGVLANPMVVIPISNRGKLVEHLKKTVHEMAAVSAFKYFQGMSPIENIRFENAKGFVAAALLEAGDLDMTPKRQMILDQKIDESDKRLSTLEKLYSSFMTLNGPQKFWEKKAEDFAGRAKTIRKWLVGAGIASALGMFGLVFWLTLNDGALDHVFYKRLASVGLAATAIFWIMRFMGRLYMSYIHLESDASERATMIGSYLAMIHNQEGGETLDRSILLHAIFRTSSTGLVSSDSVPSQTVGVSIDKIMKS